MSRFGADPLRFFTGVYREGAPWDIGGPQPAMAALLARFPPPGPALDLGCGSGDLAMHVAGSGVDVLGIDFVEAAIDVAESRKAALPPAIAGRLRFQVADALRPSLLGETFGAVLDSGFCHLFEPDVCDSLANGLAQVLRPGGRCYLHEFATTFEVPNVPRAVSAEELRERFSPARGWRTLAVESGEFLSRIAPVPAVLACFERMDAVQAPA